MQWEKSDWTTTGIKNSMICNGSTIEGSVFHSIVGLGSVVDEGAVVEDCVVLPGAHICRGAKLKKVIVDENYVVPENCEVSGSDDETKVIG